LSTLPSKVSSLERCPLLGPISGFQDAGYLGGTKGIKDFWGKGSVGSYWIIAAGAYPWFL